MRIGIFGSAQDPEAQAVAAAAERQGIASVVVESQALNYGMTCAFDGERFCYRGDDLSDVLGWYVRFVPSPLPPPFHDGERWFLYEDWLVEYMHRRERFGFYLSWLSWLAAQGIPLVNAPDAGGVMQLKPVQLAVANKLGYPTPKTLITNDPDAVRSFAREVGDVVYKPLLGGGPCERLDEEARGRLELVTTSPVIFQERVVGESLRLAFVGERLLSAVRIPPTTTVDYRADPRFQSGELCYEPVELPGDVVERTAAVVRGCGLVFSGVDVIRAADGRCVFLEANSSPRFVDVEEQLGHPISDAIVGYLLRASQQPEWYERERRATRSFAGYALPFDPGVVVGRS